MGPLMKRRSIIVLLLLSLLPGALSCAGQRPAAARPAAHNGVLDLTQWDIARDGIAGLDGEWEFYWNALLTPEDFSSRRPAPTGYFSVPETWTNYRLSGKRLPSRGYATYRLVIKTGPDRGLLALKLQEINNAHKLWINDRLVSVHGAVATSNRGMIYRNYPKLVHFQNDTGSLELVMQVSNYNDIVCGILRSIKLGTPGQIENERDLQLSFNLFLFGSLLIMGLYHIGLYILRRKEPSVLYFGVFCVLISLRSILTEERIIYAMLPRLSWEPAIRVELLTLLGAPLFMQFLASLYSEEFDRRLVAFFNYSGIVFMLIVLLTPARIFILSLVGFQIIIAIMGIYALVGLARAVVRKREGAVVLAGGFVILFITLINDILHSRMIIQTSYLVPLGLFIFIFSQSFVLSMRSSRSFSKVESMSSKLEIYANHLEELVTNRTVELEQERNTLRSRNDLIEKEIEMARRIQQQLIPAKSPAGFVYALYKPMESVGGDFYDFLPFRGSRKLGIFLSDVSGHGVPAAFITSMVKSIILQSEKYLDDPAAFLGNLNQHLSGITGGNFVTAFYCVFDPETRRIRYANAGHYPPYLISGGAITMLEGGKSIPIAITDNNELTNLRKEYKNCEDVLPQGSRLVLYTDGLIEAMMQDPSDQEHDDEPVRRLLLDLRGLPNREFVHRLMERVTDSRGGDDFDDDVCVICVDAE